MQTYIRVYLFCLRALADLLNMPLQTLHEYFKRGVLLRYTSRIRPQLTDANKVARLKWALDHVKADLTMHDMMDLVHVDEKWFFMARITNKLYLLPGEEPPHRATKSKRFIGKVMFLSAVARPRWDDTNNCMFDGKIDTWAFVQ